jgi:phage terminase small subunit
MARQRSPARDEAKKLYLDSKGTIKLVDIAAKLDIKDSQIRKWKSQDNWDDELDGKSKGALPKNNSNVTNQKVTKKEPIADEVKEAMENEELTDKQRLFCVIYSKCFNATKAYQKAYECDYITANTNGPRLLVNARIKSKINNIKQNKLNRLALSEDDIFQKYIDIAFADITDYVKFGQEEVPVMGPFGPIVIKQKGKPPKEITKIVNVVKFKESSEVDGTIISEVKQGKDGASIKLQDKLKALQWLGDRMDLLPTATREKLELEKRKMELLEKQADDLDEDIEYVIEDDTDEEKED